MKIYNLFPLLAGPFPHWTPHLERAAAMGFDWVFVNHLVGMIQPLTGQEDLEVPVLHKVCCAGRHHLYNRSSACHSSGAKNSSGSRSGRGKHTSPKTAPANAVGHSLPPTCHR